MRALGFLLGTAAITEARRSDHGRPAKAGMADGDPPPLDEATFARWRAWARESPEANLRLRPAPRPLTRPAARLPQDPATNG